MTTFYGFNLSSIFSAFFGKANNALELEKVDETIGHICSMGDVCSTYAQGATLESSELAFRSRNETKKEIMFQVKKENRQIERSKEWILEALLQLMEKKKFSEITITEICEKAGVGRQTLYRRYACKEDIFFDEFNRDFSLYLQDIFEKYGKAPSFGEIIVEAFTHWQQHYRLIHLLIKHGLENLLVKAIETQFNFMKEHKIFKIDLEDYMTEFAVGGTIFVIISWVKNGTIESPEKMGGIISSLISSKYQWK